MEEFFTAIHNVFEFIIQNFYYMNIIFAIAIIFFQRNSPKDVWLWLLLLFFIPGLGFIMYLLFHQDIHKRHMFHVKEVEDTINSAIRRQMLELDNQRIHMPPEEFAEYHDLLHYNLESIGAVYTSDNSVEIITDGEVKFQRLFDEIDKAEQYIHIQYYIFKNDELMWTLVEHLRKKAEEGVEVRILYDGMGSRKVWKKDWDKIRSYGIKIGEFFHASLRMATIRLNYRNHRKIVVIDGKVGFVGGYNVGREYISKDERFGYWRDTHLVLQGSSVTALQIRFALDWNFATKENLFQHPEYFIEYPAPDAQVGVQIISSGPDLQEPLIRNNYIRLIHKATKYVYVQTPYLVLDEPTLNALKIAARSGIDVRIMIPCKPDHPFVYWATYSYMGELLKAGAKCYTYENGFLHSKGVVTDDMALCYGTANMDIRSFSLNFEVNALVLDEEKAREMKEIFLKDLDHSKEILWEDYTKRSVWIRLKEQLFRLLAPIL